MTRKKGRRPAKRKTVSDQVQLLLEGILEKVRKSDESRNFVKLAAEIMVLHRQYETAMLTIRDSVHEMEGLLREQRDRLMQEGYDFQSVSNMESEIRSAVAAFEDASTQSALEAAIRHFGEAINILLEARKKAPIPD